MCMESNQNNSLEAGSTPVSSEKESIWSIIWNVFADPAKAFTSFKASPTILIPLILLIIFGSFLGGIQAEYNRQAQFDLLKTSTEIPQEILAQRMDEAAKTSNLRSYMIAPIILIIISVLTSLIAWFFGGIIFGGKTNFKSIWGVNLLAFIITYLGGIIKTPLIIAKGTIYVSIGLAAIYPNKIFTSFIYTLLYYLDGFAIWSIIVAGMGYGIIFGISRKKGITVSFISSLILILFSIGLSVFGLSMAGVDYTFF